MKKNTIITGDEARNVQYMNVCRRKEVITAKFMEISGLPHPHNNNSDRSNLMKISKSP